MQHKYILLVRDKLLLFLQFAIKWLSSIHFKYSYIDCNNAGYSSLSPIDHGDEDGHYSKVLLWALKNRKKEDIKNIALTGPYGSGKSSILKTFQKNYSGSDLVFLNISLATFKEEKPEPDSKPKDLKAEKTELLRLIEISILEQIFYHEKDSKIPDSRFKKIKSYSPLTLFLYSLGYLFFFISLYNYINPYFIQGVFKDIVINSWLCDSIHYGGILVIFLGAFFIIYKSVRIISAISINKLTVQNAEIGFVDKNSKSVLNHHIDEILYFFSVRPYNVVIIEDLDRFRETEIFTKLREVNLLLNNSNKTKRKEIVFVYAVRDDMFTDRDRTKFFDFIIPVIPVINSSNSSEILLKKKGNFGYKISDNLIEDLSFFVDDMRLLHNICNEYNLYKDKLDEKLNQDKLFGIITYKNIYPNDFMKLSRNEGELYDIFLCKADFLRDTIKKIEQEIESTSQEIKEIEKLFIDNIKDLRLLYILRVIEKMPGFNFFIINNKSVSIDEMTESNNFEYLKTGVLKYNQMVYNSYNGYETEREKSISVRIKDIEKLIDPAKTYVAKEQEIDSVKEGKLNSLKNKIQELEQQKADARSYKIVDLLKSNQVYELKISDKLNKSLIIILFRNGYIAEDYIDYISLFHEGSISRADYQYHISIKNELQLPYTYKLTKIERLILKINPADFQSKYILNYDLLDYLLKHQGQYKLQLNTIFWRLKDESLSSVEFISGYYEVSQHLNKFIQHLCEHWNNVWSFVSQDKTLSDSFKGKMFISIIEFASIKSIVKISKQSNLKNDILFDFLFLSIIKDHVKLKDLIKELNIKFNHLNFENSPDAMLDYIYQSNYYEINIEMLTSMIKKFGKFDQVRFDNSNYAMISNSAAGNLKSYIEENIEDYVENVYLKISANVNEEELYLIELLNHKVLTFENKEAIIEHVATKISKLFTIEDVDLYPILFEQNKVLARWGNLYHDYDSQVADEAGQEKEISQYCIEFINLIENADELSKVKNADDDDASLFWKKLIQIDAINDGSFDLISKSGLWRYRDLKIENLSENKVNSLINNDCITPCAPSYFSLKKHFDGANIRAFEKRKSDYFKIFDELTFDSTDLELVLKSGRFTIAEKQLILDACSDDVIDATNNLRLLSSLLLEENPITVDDEILFTIVVNVNVSTINRLKLFVANSSKFDFTQIHTTLNNLGSHYTDINNTAIKAKVPKTYENWHLLHTLEKRNYISSITELDDYFRVNHHRKK